MKISIAMATYNGAQYLEKQLQSFADQTHQPDELIISDDCSSDETEFIVREFAKNVSFKVEFYRNERNIGYGCNFNSALSKTTGDFVFLSDQDDVWFANKIKTMVDLANDNPSVLLFMNDALLTDEKLNDFGFTKLDQIKSGGLSLQSFVMGCCICIRKELLDLCLPIHPKYKSHDKWIVCYAIALRSRLVHKVALQYYRRHSSNESSFIANNTKKINRFFVFKSYFLKIIKQNKNQRMQALRAEILEISLLNRSMLEKIKNNEISSNSFVQYQFDLQVMIDKLKVSYDIRQSCLPIRIIKVFSIINTGRYNFNNGVKLFLGDLYG